MRISWNMHTNYVYKPNHLIFDAKYTPDSKMSEYSRKNASRVFISFRLLYLNPLWKWERARKKESEKFERITTITAPRVSQPIGSPVMRNHNITKEPLFISVALIFRNENDTAGYWMSCIHPTFFLIFKCQKVFHSIRFNSFTIRCFVCISLSLVSLLYDTVGFLRLAIKRMVTTKGKILVLFKWQQTTDTCIWNLNMRHKIMKNKKGAQKKRI